MTNQRSKSRAGRTSAARDTGSAQSLGTTRDGVTILKPKTKPTHFTTREIRSTIAQVLRDSASGQFSGVKPSGTSGKAAETAKR